MWHPSGLDSTARGRVATLAITGTVSRTLVAQAVRRETANHGDMISSQIVEAETHQERRNWAASRDPRTSMAMPLAMALDDHEALGIDARTSSGDVDSLMGRMRRVWLGLSRDTWGELIVGRLRVGEG